MSNPPLHLPIHPLSNSDGKWHHLAGVAVSNTKALYVDGVRAHFLECPGSTTQVSLKNIFIGRSVVSSDKGPFEGEMDEIRVWKYARSVQQIRETMHRYPVRAEVLNMW